MQNMVFERRTATDMVFDALFEEILTLKLMPGAKLSEADIAKRFGVSRQPVRDAFSKLESLDMLLIQPQKATKVRGFSMELVEHSRFVRLAVELEVIGAACRNASKSDVSGLESMLDKQETAVSSGNFDRFHKLDYDFHKQICEISGHPLAFDTIQECKRKIDRLCVLSLGRESEAETLLEDHRSITAGILAGDVDAARDAVRLHLSRIESTIDAVHQEHAEYFE